MPWCSPCPRYAGRSCGPTIASALNTHRRAGDPGDGAQRLGQRVHLGLVLAVGAQPLPGERDRVQPEHLDAVVGQVEDHVGVLAQHVGVRPVDVPLVVVERRPDPAVELVVPGEAARREVREHLGQRRARTRPASSGRGRPGSSRGSVASPARASLAPTRARAATWLSTRSRHRLMPCVAQRARSAPRRSSMVPRSGAHAAVVRRPRSRRRSAPAAGVSSGIRCR